jgi:hypothetical protein
MYLLRDACIVMTGILILHRNYGKGMHLSNKLYDSVAQLVEQYTFNVWVLGSNPSGITTSK